MLVLPLTNVSGATQNLGMKKILTSTHIKQFPNKVHIAVTHVPEYIAKTNDGK